MIAVNVLTPARGFSTTFLCFSHITAHVIRKIVATTSSMTSTVIAFETAIIPTRQDVHVRREMYACIINSAYLWKLFPYL